MEFNLRVFRSFCVKLCVLRLWKLFASFSYLYHVNNSLKIQSDLNPVPLDSRPAVESIFRHVHSRYGPSVFCSLIPNRVYGGCLGVSQQPAGKGQSITLFNLHRVPRWQYKPPDGWRLAFTFQLSKCSTDDFHAKTWRCKEDWSHLTCVFEKELRVHDVYGAWQLQVYYHANVASESSSLQMCLYLESIKNAQCIPDHEEQTQNPSIPHNVQSKATIWPFVCLPSVQPWGETLILDRSETV